MTNKLVVIGRTLMIRVIEERECEGFRVSAPSERRLVMGRNTFDGFCPVIGRKPLNKYEMFMNRSMNRLFELWPRKSDGFRTRGCELETRALVNDL
jgi:hypothetical protein